MAERTLIAIVREDDKNPGTLIVASPVVGVADGSPRTGIYINPLDRILTIRVLHERHVLRLPRDRQGRIVETFIESGITPVAYNGPLVRIDPKAIGQEAAGAKTEAGAAETSTKSEDILIVRAPTEGIFYRRPSPDQPPYVEEGSPVSTGTVLGLVEVMKCFNQVTYGGPGLPHAGVVEKILVEDSSEVDFGQELFWIRTK
jgi:biotin carboxyl carrier protein